MATQSTHVAEIIRICQQACDYLLIAMPWWADDETGIEIRHEMENAASRDVKCHLIIRPDRTNQKTIRFLASAGVKIVQLPKLHGKAVSSESELATITLNFFNKDAIRNINFATYTTDEDSIRRFADYFHSLASVLDDQLDGPELPTEASKLIPECDITSLLPYQKLNPLQSKCARHALYGKENLLVIAPTGAGKTVVGLMAMLSAALLQDAKAVWLVPSRALANEIKTSLQGISHPKLKVLSLLGGEEAPNTLLESHNIWVCTTEKFESILRRRSATRIVEQVYSIVVDEIHLLADRTRGPILESILARKRNLAPFPRIIGLSATLQNDEEFSGWLNARLLRSDWKPNLLTKDVVAYPAVRGEPFSAIDKRRQEKLTQILLRISNNPTQNGSTLVFCRSKPRCISSAIDLAREFANDPNALDGIDPKKLPTDKITDELLQLGIGLYFKGHSRSYEAIVAFKQGDIRFLFCTTGLAQGVNTPAKVVVISETVIGLDTPLDINTANQMLGRAGRGEGNQGWGIILCPEYEKDSWTEHKDKSSIVTSAMSEKLDDVLLAEIALRNIRSSEEAVEWYKSTFQAFCNQDWESIGGKINLSISFLLKEGLILIGQDEGLEASRTGNACIRLMTDITKSVNLIKGLVSVKAAKSAVLNEKYLLTLIAQALHGQAGVGVLSDNLEFRSLVQEILNEVGIKTSDALPDYSLDLAALFLLVYDSQRIGKLSKELEQLRYHSKYYVYENAPRYLALLHQIGSEVHNPWICMCAFDLSKRISWYQLNPPPGRGRGRILSFIEGLADSIELKTAMSQIWESLHNYSALTPNDIPKSATSFTFCRDEKRCREAMSNVLYAHDISLTYLAKDDAFIIYGLPPDTYEAYVRVDSSSGSTQRHIERATSFNVQLPLSEKDEEEYSILVYVSTKSDRILLSRTLNVLKEQAESSEDRFISLFERLSVGLPSVAITRRPIGLRRFFREKILGPIPRSEEFAEAIGKKDYLADIASMFRFLNDTDAITAWRIHETIEKMIIVAPSLGDEPFSFDAVANVIKAKAGTILEKELTKAALGINAGLEMGVVYNSNGGRVYAVVHSNGQWYIFENLPNHARAHLKSIIPATLRGTVQTLEKPEESSLSSTPRFDWVEEFSFGSFS